MLDLIAGTLVSLALLLQPDALPGRYTLDRDASDNPATLAEQAARDAGRFQRNRVRAELMTLLTPPRTLEVRALDPGFLITGDAERSMRAVPGETDVLVRTPRGEIARQDAMLRGDALVIRITGEKGNREQVLEATDAGLVVTTTYDVAFRREPIRQRTVYRREAP